MATVARRAAPPVRRVGAAAAGPAPSSGYSGAAGIAKMQEEEERSQQAREASAQMAGMPFRFFCSVGETRQVVVIDDKPNWFRYEHNLQNSRTGRYDIYTACINEHANCPVCRHSNKGSYYGMFLTIIDLTPYTNKDGDEVLWSKKLLVVKPQQQKKFMRMWERHGNIRGLVLDMTRDTDKDAGIGNDIAEVGFYEETDLQEFVTEFKDKKDVMHEVLGYEVYDYDALFPLPTEEMLRAVVGGRAEPGNRDGDRRDTRGAPQRGGRQGDGWDDQQDRAPAGRPAVRQAVRRPPPPRAEPEYADDPPAEEAAPAARRLPPPPTRRPAAAAPAAPAQRLPVRRAAPAPAQDDPPQRTAPAPLRRPAVAARAPAPAAEPAATGGAASLADRRRLLRRP